MWALAPLSAFADSWHYEKEVDVKKYTFGSTTIKKIRDTTKNQRYPDYTIEIYSPDGLEARYRGLFFQEIAASKDNKNFAGISNHGLHRSAIVVFGAQGKLIAVQMHDGVSTKIDYCSKSVTLDREWFNRKNPNLRFSETEVGPDILVNDCKGDSISLVDLFSPKKIAD